MTRTTEFFLPLDLSDHPLEQEAARHLRIKTDELLFCKIVRKSLDARKGRPMGFRVRIEYALHGDPVLAPTKKTAVPCWNPSVPKPRVVIVGSGPAGTWAALRLAEAGVPSIVLERGKPIQPRRHDLAGIQRGRLNPDSNYCFGEGGAGTYSDGKLYTRTKDREAVDQVLADLIRFGAPPEIAFESRPHVGSNRLPKVLQALRTHLESAGVVYRFESQLSEIEIRDGRVHAVKCGSGEEFVADKLVLAVGHSARDVYQVLKNAGIALERKGTAVGVRLEHPQPTINQIQYGRSAGDPRLPAAFYEVSAQAQGRGVYSFCMCPGGFIVPAATEEGGVVVNGMSLSRRDSPFANSAMVVSIQPSDFGGDESDPTSGVAFQRKIEQAAYVAGQGAYQAPAQRLLDFMGKRESRSLPSTTYQPGIIPAALEQVFPTFIVDALRVGLESISKRLPGFAHPDAVLIAAETRTSSPVRIIRESESFQSVSTKGLYPAGEGAGYAGGIVSAAIDGMRIANAILTEGR
jgi:uncharacterized FAD-dependent dehydrogenase